MQSRYHNLARATSARLLAALMLAGALLGIPAARPPAAEAAQIVGSAQNISNTKRNSESPQISASAGRLFAIWTERSGEPQFDGELASSKAPIDQPFEGATIRNTKLDSKYQWADITSDANGDRYIAYSAINTVYFEFRPLSGGRSTKSVANDNYPNAAKIARAANGRVWVVWRNNSGSLHYRYSDDNGISWKRGSDGGTVSNGSGQALSLDITVDSNNTPYVVWYNNGGSNKGQIRYAAWNGSAFASSNVTNSSQYDADPVVSADGAGALHLAYRTQSGSNWTIQYARKPAGGGWVDFQPIYVVSGDPQFSPAIDSDPAGNLYVTFPVPAGGNNQQIDIMAKLAGESWQGPLGLKVPNRRFDSRNAVAGTTDNGNEAHVLIQSEKGNDDAEIFYQRVLFEPPLTATPVLNKYRSKDQVSLSFTNVSGDPDGVRWNWGSAPTDADNDSGGWKPFGSQSVAVPVVDTSGACQQQYLYVQIKNAKRAQDPSTITPLGVVVDRDVQAAVRTSNPNVADLTSGSGDALSDGASDGDPGFTRDKRFFLGIYNVNDCSALSSFSIPTIGASGVITSSQRIEKFVDLPAATPSGSTVNIGVNVADGLGNVGPFPGSIVYDTDLPTYNAGGVQADDNTKQVVRTLTFSGVDVNDATYSQNAGKPFWGVWLANSTTNVAADSPTLKWYPAGVAIPGATFSVRWSLFTGLNLGLNTDKSGTYYIYARFLDGAGNATTQAIKTTAVLDPGYSFATQYLPTTQR